MRQNKLKIISAKDLGRLNLPDFCPRCFWIERNYDKPPAVFPGIFSTLDAVSKRSVHRSFLQRNAPPGWLPVTDAVEVEEGDTYFKLPVEYGGWVLTGKPDDIFRTKASPFHFVDGMPPLSEGRDFWTPVTLEIALKIWYSLNG